MTNIKIETDARGHTMILMADEERFGAGGRGLAVENILIRASDGHVFIKSNASRDGLERPSEVEIEMIEYFFRETDGPHAPDIFAGDPPPDG